MDKGKWIKAAVATVAVLFGLYEVRHYVPALDAALGGAKAESGTGNAASEGVARPIGSVYETKGSVTLLNNKQNYKDGDNIPVAINKELCPNPGSLIGKQIVLKGVPQTEYNGKPQYRVTSAGQFEIK